MGSTQQVTWPAVAILWLLPVLFVDSPSIETLFWEGTVPSHPAPVCFLLGPRPLKPHVAQCTPRFAVSTLTAPISC